MEYSEYIVYVDESGDHGLKNVDPNYPVFVLVFCIFKVSDYIERAMPALSAFKFKYFGHDQVVLHENDIRKDRGAFAILKSSALKNRFMSELSTIVDEMPFQVVASVIRKDAHRKKYPNPANPYDIAMAFGLERVYYCLSGMGQSTKTTHVVVERRGRQEDEALELEFRRICDGDNYPKVTLPFNLIFADKKTNSTGLQLADLIARPIGLKTFKPDQPNKAYDIIEKKFRKNPSGKIEGAGLKYFP